MNDRLLGAIGTRSGARFAAFASRKQSQTQKSRLLLSLLSSSHDVLTNTGYSRLALLALTLTSRFALLDRTINLILSIRSTA
jgi:hypothetical protein